MAGAARVVGSLLFLPAAAAALGFAGAGAFAFLGWSDDAVTVTDAWSYRPADQPWLHAAFGALNLGGFVCVTLGSLAVAFAALRAGALGVLVGSGLVAFALALTGLAIANPIGLAADQRGLFCVVSTILIPLGGAMVRAWWRQPPPPRVSLRG